VQRESLCLPSTTVAESLLQFHHTCHLAENTRASYQGMPSGIPYNAPNGLGFSRWVLMPL